MTCDIAAPRIIVPERVTDESSAVVVFDLGNIHLGSGEHTLMSPRATDIDADTVDTGKLTMLSSSF